MDYRTYELKKKRIYFAFDDPDTRSYLGNVMTGIDGGCNLVTGKWEIFEERDRNNPAKVCEFFNESQFYDWMYNMYYFRATSEITRMRWFVNAQKQWIHELLSTDNDEDKLIHYFRCDGKYSYEQFEKTLKLKELLFAEVFSYEKYRSLSPLVKVFIDWVQYNDEFIDKFEATLIQLFSGDCRDFFIGYEVFSSYLTSEIHRKKRGDYYFHINVEKIKMSFSDAVNRIRENYGDIVEVQMTTSYSIDLWNSIAIKEQSHLKYCGFSLIGENDPLLSLERKEPLQKQSEHSKSADDNGTDNVGKINYCSAYTVIDGKRIPVEATMGSNILIRLCNDDICDKLGLDPWRYNGHLAWIDSTNYKVILEEQSTTNLEIDADNTSKVQKNSIFLKISRILVAAHAVLGLLTLITNAFAKNGIRSWLHISAILELLVILFIPMTFGIPYIIYNIIAMKKERRYLPYIICLIFSVLICVVVLAGYNM